MPEGSARCWGKRAIELGGGGISGVTVNRGNGCARTQDGSARCWGDNESGEVGDGTRAPRTEPVPVVGLPPVAQIGARDAFSCARTMMGEVYDSLYDRPLGRIGALAVRSIHPVAHFFDWIEAGRPVARHVKPLYDGALVKNEDA
jgi:hypothetical protein